jgi:hypothetical protein
MCDTCTGRRESGHDLMGNTEAAELLGVKRARIGQLRASGKNFPQPVAVLRSGPVFCGAEVREFLSTWDRRPGRPPIHREVTKGEDA